MEENVVRVLQPSGIHVTVSIEVFYYLLMQIPKGKITRFEDMEKYLAECFYADYVHLEYRPFSTRNLIDPGYAMQVNDYVPMHREVSTSGCIKNNFNIDKLQKEGFTILPPRKNQHRHRIKDYKDYLFDFNTLHIDKELLEDVNRNGLKSYLPNDDKYKFSQEEILDAYYKIWNLGVTI